MKLELIRMHAEHKIGDYVVETSLRMGYEASPTVGQG
jgi:hypothetical protein